MKTFALLLPLVLAAACGGDAQPPASSPDMTGGTAANPAAPYIRAGVAPGACLLEYNSSLVAPNASPCCYAYGGPNTCNQPLACGAAGGGCCKIYSTSNTVIGSNCCFYDVGKSVSAGIKDACTALLAGR